MLKPWQWLWRWTRVLRCRKCRKDNRLTEAEALGYEFDLLKSS